MFPDSLVCKTSAMTLIRCVQRSALRDCVQTFWHGFSVEADMPTIHRTNFFYLVSLIFLFINIILWVLIKIMSPKIVQRFGLLSAGWVAALPVVVNFYICFLIGFLGVLNNASSLQLSNYVYLNYLGPILLIIWKGLAIYFMSTKKSFDLLNYFISIFYIDLFK